MNTEAVGWLRSRDYGTVCPVCGYDLGVPAWDGPISSGRACPSCGITFGRDDTFGRGDSGASIICYLQWRAGWIDRHMPWHDMGAPAPAGWDPVVQLRHVRENFGASYSAWLASLPPPQTPEHMPYWRSRAAQRLAELGRPPVAIEALWDGDTTGWFVSLYAIIAHPSVQHPRYTEAGLINLRGPGGDIRIFNGDVPPWPEARMASEIGQSLAWEHTVPFYFHSQSEPDDQAPRWWDETE